MEGAGGMCVSPFSFFFAFETGTKEKLFPHYFSYYVSLSCTYCIWIMFFNTALHTILLI